MKRWLFRGALIGLTAVVALFAAALIASRHLDSALRQDAVAYLEDHFDSYAEVGALRVEIPSRAPLRLLSLGGRGALVTVEGDHIVLRRRGQPELPPIFVLRHFTASVDPGRLFAGTRAVRQVTLDGMEINIPPKGARPSLGGRKAKRKVVIGQVIIHDAVLSILPKQSGKAALRFQLHDIHLQSAGNAVAMKYAATLANAKPPGEIRSSGSFGPWATAEPGSTPLAGSYVFENADLGVFHGIAGTLRSTGSFQGTLSAITAHGEASVPDFRLTASGNPVPLKTRFEVLVDGTNGNVDLKPVDAVLGSTHFATTGAIIRKEGESHRTISLTAFMPAGNLRDVLSLAMKGPPIMEGALRLNTKIVIPPLGGKVEEKLVLDGSFHVTHGRFLRMRIQDKIDALSRRGHGDPGNEDIADVVDQMSGKYHLSGGDLRFQNLEFTVPGAAVQVGGTFDLDTRRLDFHGALKLETKVSHTVKGWKHWLLKPLDPFLANHGVGTYLHIKVEGTAEDPQFGLDPGGSGHVQLRRGEAAGCSEAGLDNAKQRGC
jgi:hypothetical protein